MHFDAKPNMMTKQIRDDLILYDSANRDVHVLNPTAAKVKLTDRTIIIDALQKALFDSDQAIQKYARHALEEIARY